MHHGNRASIWGVNDAWRDIDSQSLTLSIVNVFGYCEATVEESYTSGGETPIMFARYTHWLNQDINCDLLERMMKVVSERVG